MALRFRQSAPVQSPVVTEAGVVLLGNGDQLVPTGGNKSLKTYTLADHGPAEFKRGIRRLAVQALENGLADVRDPYRQAALGIKVMTGIGEFRADNQPTQINVLVESVPGEWKERYVGSGSTDAARIGKGAKEISG